MTNFVDAIHRHGFYSRRSFEDGDVSAFTCTAWFVGPSRQKWSVSPEKVRRKVSETPPQINIAIVKMSKNTNNSTLLLLFTCDLFSFGVSISYYRWYVYWWLLIWKKSLEPNSGAILKSPEYAEKTPEMSHSGYLVFHRGSNPVHPEYKFKVSRLLPTCLMIGLAVLKKLLLFFIRITLLELPISMELSPSPEATSYAST
jgi:hypothetical protein